MIDKKKGNSPKTKFPKILNLVCAVYDKAVAAGNPPDLVLDLTTSGLSSEVMKAVTRDLGLPTVSGSFGGINETV